MQVLLVMAILAILFGLIMAAVQNSHDAGIRLKREMRFSAWMESFACSH